MTSLELHQQSNNYYCVNPKTVDTRNIPGMSLCCEEKEIEKLCGLWFLISYLIRHRTIKMSESNKSVHGFWIRTVIELKALTTRPPCVDLMPNSLPSNLKLKL